MATEINDANVLNAEPSDNTKLMFVKEDGSSFLLGSWIDVKGWLKKPAKEYWALLDQIGNLDPTAAPLRNDYTSPVTFARGDTGLYSIACDEFVAGKTFAEIQSFNTEGELGYATIEGNGLHKYVTIATYQLSDLLAGNFIKGDGVLGNTLIKIYTLP